MPRKQGSDRNLVKVDNPDDQDQKHNPGKEPKTLVTFDSPDDPPEPGEEEPT